MRLYSILNAKNAKLAADYLIRLYPDLRATADVSTDSRTPWRRRQMSSRHRANVFVLQFGELARGTSSGSN